MQSIGRYELAVTAFTKALAFDSSYADAYYDLGRIWIDRGSRQEGLPYLRRALDLGNLYALDILRNYSK